jgi:hypothetical protein
VRSPRYPYLPPYLPFLPFFDFPALCLVWCFDLCFFPPEEVLPAEVGEPLPVVVVLLEVEVTVVVAVPVVVEELHTDELPSAPV